MCVGPGDTGTRSRGSSGARCGSRGCDAGRGGPEADRRDSDVRSRSLPHPVPTSLRPSAKASRPAQGTTEADAGCAGAARGYLELGVAEHHQGRAGADAVALDEGHVHAPDPPQPREGRVPLPRLRVPDHDEGLQPGLLPEGDTRTSSGFRTPHVRARCGGALRLFPGALPVSPPSSRGAGLGDPRSAVPTPGPGTPPPRSRNPRPGVAPSAVPKRPARGRPLRGPEPRPGEPRPGTPPPRSRPPLPTAPRPGAGSKPR